MFLLLAVAVFGLALLVGLIGNISGIGGGVMIILFLIYGFGFNPLDASGLSLLTLVFSSMTGFVQNMRRGLVNIRLFLAISIVAVSGALIGSVVASYISSGSFKGVFSVILISLGLFSVFASYSQTRRGVAEYRPMTASSSDTGAVSLAAGIVSGFVGIGIGGIIGTYLTAVKKYEPRVAIATIIAATLPVTVAGMAIHFYYTGLVNIVYAPPLVIGAFIGGIAGSWIIRKAPQVSLRFFQGYIIIAFGVLSAILYVLTTY